VKLFLGWWRRGDNYNWLSAYLEHRRVLGFTQVLMAAIVAALGVIPPLMSLTAHGPQGPWPRALAMLIGGCCAVMTVCWLRRWPTRRQSQAFTVVSTTCVAVACLIIPSPTGGLLGCAAFASLAGYAAFFQSSRFLVFTMGSAITVAAVCTARLSQQTGILYAACNLVVTMIAILAIPLSAQLLLYVLGTDAAKSHTDPLTGLTNRRGFYRLARRLISSGEVVSVLMIDLDDFKRINDTHGHAEGDRALQTIADILREVVPRDAVVARAGGEEFLVAHAVPAAAMSAPALLIRERIRATSWQLTASEGVAELTLPAVFDDAHRLVDNLVSSADDAMYVAKRSGGNQTCYAAA